jgi:type III secretory pathway lipoprotein EscJ
MLQGFLSQLFCCSVFFDRWYRGSYTCIVYVAACLLLISGCDSIALIEDVSQNQSREIIVALNKEGIYSKAERKSGASGKYDIKVNSDDYLRANLILQERDLPKKDKISIEQMLSQNSFLPASKEIEDLRYDYVLSLEFEELLLTFPSVKSAKVNVKVRSLPAVINTGRDVGLNNPGKTFPAPSATIIILEKSSVDEKQRIYKDQVIEIAKRVVPNITQENVWLYISQEEGEVQNTPFKKDFNPGKTESKKDESGTYSIEANNNEIYNRESGVGLKREESVKLTPFLLDSIKIPERFYTKLTLVFLLSIFLVALASVIIGYWFGIFKGRNFNIRTFSSSDIEGIKINKSISLDKSKKELLE